MKEQQKKNNNQKEAAEKNDETKHTFANNHKIQARCYDVAEIIIIEIPTTHPFYLNINHIFINVWCDHITSNRLAVKSKRVRFKWIKWFL